MAKILIALILWAGLASASTGTDMIADIRKLTGDMGSASTPVTWKDSTILAQINLAIVEVGVLGLAVTVWDTLTLGDDSLNYALARSPIELQTGYRRDLAGGMFGVSMVNVNDFWNVSDQVAFCLVDDNVFVTQKLSELYQLIVVYTASPSSLDSAGDTCEIPDAIIPSVTYLASANLMASTRTQANVAIGNLYRQAGTQMLSRWLAARRGKPTDSLVIPR